MRERATTTALLGLRPIAAPADERFASFAAVIRRVPPGRVVTYGLVAELAGYPRCARQVGHFLRHAADERLPWHRVINARGGLSPRGDGESVDEQRRRLLAEGVPFSPAGLVDLGAALWCGEEGTSRRTARAADDHEARERS